MGFSFKAAAPPKIEVPPAPVVGKPRDAQDMLGNSGVSSLISAAGTAASQAKESVTPTLNQAGKQSPKHARSAKKGKGKGIADGVRTTLQGGADKARKGPIDPGTAATQGGVLVEASLDYVIHKASTVLTGDHAQHMKTLGDALHVLQDKAPSGPSEDLVDAANVQQIAVEHATSAQQGADELADQAKDQTRQAEDTAKKQTQQAEEAAAEQARQAQEQADEAARQAQEAAEEAARQAEEEARRAAAEAQNAAEDPGGTAQDTVNNVVNTVTGWHP